MLTDGERLVTESGYRDLPATRQGWFDRGALSAF